MREPGIRAGMKGVDVQMRKRLHRAMVSGCFACLSVIVSLLVSFLTLDPAYGSGGSDPHAAYRIAGLEKDIASPAIAISQPTTGFTYWSLEDHLALRGSCRAKVGVRDITWTNSRGGSGVGSGTSTWTINRIPLHEGGGTNIVTVTARDFEGNVGTATLIIYYNPSPRVTTFYISPSGRDSDNGLSMFTSWKTFAHAFSSMKGGDELILMDGIFSEVSGTGNLRLDAGDEGPASMKGIPHGTGPQVITTIHALHPGKATVSVEEGATIAQQGPSQMYIRIFDLDWIGRDPS